MSDSNPSLDQLLEAFKDSTKTLNGLFVVEEAMNRPDASVGDVCEAMLQALPTALQHPNHCMTRITIEDEVFESPGFKKTPLKFSAEIKRQDNPVGHVHVCYKRDVPSTDENIFLDSEKQLIQTLADRFSHFLMYQKMKKVFRRWHKAERDLSEKRKDEWEVALALLRQTDINLFLRISLKMLNFLCWSGIRKADKLRRSIHPGDQDFDEELDGHANRPHKKRRKQITTEFAQKISTLAKEYMRPDEILARIQQWIQEDMLNPLVLALHRHQPLGMIADALAQHYHSEHGGPLPISYNARGLQVALIRRLLSDQLEYIRVGKNFIEIEDIHHLLQKAIFSSDSQGRIGGKGSGLVLSWQILRKCPETQDTLKNLKVPKTWFVTSDLMIPFMHFNNLDEIVEQKYKDVQQVRLEYPHIVHTLKNSTFPQDIRQGLSLALDDFKDAPLIVRSSSLLEDRVGAVFSGKYKSLFLANQGTKEERLEALLDAIAEVYASAFGPDPIEYRAERGLLDFKEEMGILIQEVVGSRVGPYFFPAFAGVAFSRNEFRWSPRIRREDGVVRIVPGLGTRAVDRTSDDYPVLFAPGRPGLRVNASVEETVRYSPQFMDVINVETNTFETVRISDVLKEYGDEYPALEQVVSIYDQGLLKRPTGLTMDVENNDMIPTFEGLVSHSPFVEQVQTILKRLEENLRNPVDVEFASDGKDFYLLQCRPQSSTTEDASAPIPANLDDDEIVFSANRYVSNGRVPEITHIVYVDPQAYAGLESLEELHEVGRAVGRLNKFLTKQQFILMGPGRWGSRGDIKLGVNVTYSDINNTAMLIEVARKKGKYVPDLSFGTHFFQDLVEAGIRYLPLYPDDEGVHFNETFLTYSKNMLAEVLPQYEHLSHVLRLIDVPQSTGGKVLKVPMNADLDQAVGHLADPGGDTAVQAKQPGAFPSERRMIVPENAWRWRLDMAKKIAGQLDPERFGVAGIYVIGSTRSNKAGPASDIDLVVHFTGTEEQRAELETWFEGWSLSLDEFNYLQSGYRSEGLLDVHFVTDEEVAAKKGYAKKIGAATDAALPLKMKGQV